MKKSLVIKKSPKKRVALKKRSSVKSDAKHIVKSSLKKSKHVID